MIRLYVPDDLAGDTEIALSAAQSHYLKDVMRRKAGDAVLVFNGRDGEWRALIAKADRRSVTLRIEAEVRPQTRGPDLELIAALVKRARLETIVEKATELGARRVRLVTTRFTNADRANVARLSAIAVEAAEQTGRLDVPEIIEPLALERLLADWPAERRLMFCDEAGEAAPILDVLIELSGGGFAPLPPPASGRRSPFPAEAGQEKEAAAPFSSLATPALSRGKRGRGTTRSVVEGAQGRIQIPPFAILIGPEGGFAAEERAALRALPFVLPVGLGPRVLRADTAAIAALSLWQAALGDWRAP